MTHSVKLEVFEGPIDLLLHLITRRRVDIYEVSLAAIAGEYLAAIEELPDLDLEAATGFLVVAASLLELKSARLLPSGGGGHADEGWLEERDLLLGRLVECATFREAGAWLAARLEEGDRLFGRTVEPEEPYARAEPDPLEGLCLEHIAAAAAGALLTPAPATVDVSHVAPITASVRQAVAEVAAALEGRGPLSFRELCGATRDRIEVVVRFLALLELFKAGAVDLSQAERFGDIRARWTGQTRSETVMQEAEEYALE